MSPGRISARERRVLLAGGGLIAALLLAVRGIPAWKRWDADARAGAAEQMQAAARAAADVRGLSVLEDSVTARQARLVALAPRVLDGATPAAAGATLASLVSGAAARSGVSLGTVQVLGDTAAQGTFARVAVHGDATGDLAGISALLARLEEGPELLAVREISITQPEPGGPADRAESLRLEFTVEGLALHRRPEPWP